MSIVGFMAGLDTAVLYDGDYRDKIRDSITYDASGEARLYSDIHVTGSHVQYNTPIFNTTQIRNREYIPVKHADMWTTMDITWTADGGSGFPSTYLYSTGGEVVYALVQRKYNNMANYPQVQLYTINGNFIADIPDIGREGTARISVRVQQHAFAHLDDVITLRYRVYVNGGEAVAEIYTDVATDFGDIVPSHLRVTGLDQYYTSVNEGTFTVREVLVGSGTDTRTISTLALPFVANGAVQDFAGDVTDINATYGDPTGTSIVASASGDASIYTTKEITQEQADLYAPIQVAICSTAGGDLFPHLSVVDSNLHVLGESGDIAGVSLEDPVAVSFSVNPDTGDYYKISEISNQDFGFIAEN